jgi:hypothetical protein
MLRAAGHYLHSPPSARNAIGEAVARAMAAVKPEPPWLDQLIVIEELDALIDQRPHGTITRVLSRPANAKGKLGAVVAELAGGFGVFTKVGARWLWEEGRLADVAAMVSDELLPQVGDDLAAYSPSQ